MDIEKLKALKTAVEIGSITQAAEHMGYSQPGLTGMLKRLEQEIGYPLLRRGTKGVRLTEAGEAVMPYIERVLESSRALERALADHAPARERICAIGSYTSITAASAAQHEALPPAPSGRAVYHPRRQLHGYRAVARRREN